MNPNLGHSYNERFCHSPRDFKIYILQKIILSSRKENVNKILAILSVLEIS